MTSTLEYLAVECGVAVEELNLWVERRWVRPDHCDDTVTFNEADRARLRMIAEFHRDLAIDDEAMPVVLDLLDRLHAARARLRGVLQAVSELPESAQAPILRCLERDTKP